MARTGLYQSDVKKARDGLIAQGKHPSVDAVRVALGNTGSKTTIHKYLRELEDLDGGQGPGQVTVSDEIQGLVARLAAQLQIEGAAQVKAADAQVVLQEQRHKETVTALQSEAASLRTQLQRVEAAFHAETLAYSAAREALQRETIARTTLEQQVIDLTARLSDNETHRKSLEEKHVHARDALEHYRQSVKELRDQDQRRHEQQIQQMQAEQRQLQQSLAVKQEEATRLNQEATRLVADLSHLEKSLYEEQNRSRHLNQRLEAMQALAQRVAQLQEYLGQKEGLLERVQSQLAATDRESDALRDQIQASQVALATAHAKLEAQQSVVAELKAYWENPNKAIEKNVTNS